MGKAQRSHGKDLEKEGGVITEFTKDARQAIEDRLKMIMCRLTLSKEDMLEIEKELRSSLYEQAESAAGGRGSATVSVEDVEKVCLEERAPDEIATCYIKAYAPRLERAGFWPKAVAYVIDSVIVLSLQVLCTYTAFKLIYGGPVTAYTDLINSVPFADTLIWVFVVVTALCYFMFSEARYGKTIGKHLLGLKVLKADGTRIGYKEAFLRNITSALGFYHGYAYILLDAAIALIFFGRDRQRASDKVAGTMVIGPGHRNDAPSGFGMPRSIGTRLDRAYGRFAELRARAYEARGIKKHLVVAGKLALLLLTSAITVLTALFGLFFAVGFTYAVYVIVKTGSLPAFDLPSSLVETSLWFNVLIYLLQNIVFVAITIVFLVLVDKKRLFPKEPLQRMALRAGRWLSLGILLDAVLILGYMAFVLVSGLSAVQMNGLRAYAPGTLAFSIVMTAILALSVGIGEEMLFRRYIQGYLTDKYGIAIAIVATSILFTSLHVDPFGTLGTPLAYLNLFAWSLAIGYIYAATGSIWACVGFHFFEDFVLFNFPVKETIFGIKPILLLSDMRDFAAFNVSIGGLEDIFYLAILLALMAGLYLYNKNRRMALKRSEAA